MDTLKTAAPCTMKSRLHSLVPCLAMALSLTAATNLAAVLFDAPGHAVVEGTPVAASGGEPGAAWKLLDWRGRETGFSGSFDMEGKTVLPPLPAGYYRLNTLATLATLAVVPPPAGAGGSAPRPLKNEPLHGSFFGADCAIDELHREADCPWNGGDAIRTVADLAQMAGFTHIRGRHNWARMQPSSGAQPNCDGLIANAALFRERGIGVSGLLYGTPAWAGRLKKLPGDLAAIYRSCRDIAEAFGDNVMDWEFFNEPDIGFAPEPVWDYAAAFKAASLGFKAANPQKPVLCAGLCQSPKGIYLKTFLENDAAPYFDVFNYHTYAVPSEYRDFIAEMRDTLGTVGAADRPIWMTECGTNFEGPATEESVRKGFKAHSPEQELVVAEFAPKSQIAMMKEGVERNFFFILAAYSERGGAKDWGLIRRDGTVKPAYSALATIAHELGDATLAGALDAGKGLRAYLFDHPDGTQTVAFWSESPIDKETNGMKVVKPEPDNAREWRLEVPNISHRDTEAQSDGGKYRLTDMCGMVSQLQPQPDGALLLPATRFPSYVSGLRGLRAAAARSDSQNSDALIVQSASGDAGHKSVANQGALAPIVFRVDLAPGDFEVSNNKTLAVAKCDEPHLCVQVWNLSDEAKTGTVEVAGAILEGLPEGPIAIAPLEHAEFDCILKATEESIRTMESNATLTLTGHFEDLPSSRLAMPVLFEDLFLASCETVPIDWKDPSKWTRNDSADEYSVVWDEAEQALRFDVKWKNPGVGRWFYPVLKLPAGGPNLEGALRVAFEVKTAQDKVENDFGECCLMLLRGEKGGSPAEWLRYFPPTGSWERRYAELSSVKDLHEVDAIRLGANPRGMHLTFWVKNIVVLKAAKPVKEAAPLRVALTFDDSLKDDLLVAAPMLEERGWRGTFCIVTDWVGRDDSKLTWDDVRELVRRGHEIATHTKSHKNLITLLDRGQEDEIRRELLDSAKKILEETGISPRFMFSPFVCQNEKTAQISRECGLRQADVPRYNFGSNNCDRVAAVVDELIGKGAVRADFLHHGVSQADHGGWCSFVDRESFRRHLDTLAELERKGKIIVTDYDGMASNCRLLAKDWPRHGILSLSFDDASFDQWEAAFPLFAKYDARTTFFVVGTNRLDFAKKALAEGHEIGIHGLNHRDATPAVEDGGEDWFWKADIAPQLAAFGEAGVPIRSYAYPNCRRTDRTDALFFSRGISRVRGTGSAFPPNPNPFDPKGEKLDKWRPVATADWLFYPAVDFLNARLVPNVIMGEAYHTDIEDIMRAIRRAGERAEALFIVSHGISPNAKGISMKTEWLERMLSSAADLGVVVRGIR